MTVSAATVLLACVACGSAHHAANRLNLTAVAVQHGPATQLLLPSLQQDGHMTVTELRAVPRPADQAGIGQLIPLSTSDSVALVKINASGAHSAPFVLSSPSLRPADVDQTATQLAREID
jgi:hypothetical protein